MTRRRRRIVSLLPSATEIVCLLGAREDLVGVSHECDHPESVVGLPVLTRAKCRPSLSSVEIDRSVRDLVRGALAVYDVDTQLLGEVDPDVIVTQDLCDVCAVAFSDVAAAVRSLTRSDVEIVNLRPQRLKDIFADIERTAVALEREPEGAAVLRSLRARLEAVGERSHGAGTRPRVLTIEWIDPVMLGGLWMPELVELAGGECLVTRPGDRAPTVSIEDLRALQPDVVVVKPCGFSIRRTLSEIDLLTERLPWTTWPAARSGRVYLVDGNAYFNRPGPRIVDSLEILAGCVHPELFSDFRDTYSDAVIRLDEDRRQRPFVSG